MLARGGPLVVGAGMFAVGSAGWRSQHFEQWLNQLVAGKLSSLMHAVVSLPDSDTERTRSWSVLRMNKESADGLQQCIVTLLSSTIRGEAEDGVKVFSRRSLLGVEEIWSCSQQLNQLINLSGATERLFGGHFGQGKQGPAMLRSSGGSNQGLAPPGTSIFLRSSL